VPRFEGLEERLVLSPGQLDATFNQTGFQTLALNPGVAPVTPGLVAVQPDGKVVLAGTALISTTGFGGTDDFGVARLNADGTLDASFGSGGSATVGVTGSPQLEATGMALQPDGKILVAGGGLGPDSMLIARFNPDGTVDTSFGTGGTGTVSFTGTSVANAIALQPDGKIVLAGSFSAGLLGNEFAIARLTAAGQPDASFGTGGLQTVTFPDSAQANALAIQPDGKIVVGGAEIAAASGGANLYALTRLNPDGTVDTSFGTGGQQTADAQAHNTGIEGLALQPDGKIVAVGGSQGVFGVARFLPIGPLDTSFGSGGTMAVTLGDPTASLGLGGPSEEAFGVVVEPNGRLLVAGTVGTTFPYSSFGVVQIDPGGVVDPQFGTNGSTLIPFAIDPGTPGNLTVAQADGLALTPDGKVVVGGLVAPQSGLGGGSSSTIQPMLGAARLLLNGESALPTPSPSPTPNPNPSPSPGPNPMFPVVGPLPTTPVLKPGGPQVPAGVSLVPPHIVGVREVIGRRGARTIVLMIDQALNATTPTNYPTSYFELLGSGRNRAPRITRATYNARTQGKRI
jgi:uncharacterized delta-60 repeat protein